MTHEEDAEKPLDPAVERVRRKLVRFAIINVSILMLALMAVVLALVYRGAGTRAPATDRLHEGRIALPEGARILSQSVSGERIALHIETPDGRQSIIVYSTEAAGVVARIAIEQAPPAD